MPGPVLYGEFPAIRVFGLLILVAAMMATPAVALAQDQAEVTAIKTVIETMAKSFNKDDVQAMMAHFSDDAMIYVRSERQQVPKTRYTELVTKLMKDRNVVSFELRDMTVTLVDPAHATVLGTTFIVTRTERLSSRAEYKLEKRDGRWLIVSTDLKS